MMLGCSVTSPRGVRPATTSSPHVSSSAARARTRARRPSSAEEPRASRHRGDRGAPRSRRGPSWGRRSRQPGGRLPQAPPGAARSRRARSACGASPHEERVALGAREHRARRTASVSSRARAAPTRSRSASAPSSGPIVQRGRVLLRGAPGGPRLEQLRPGRAHDQHATSRRACWRPCSIRSSSCRRMPSGCPRRRGSSAGRVRVRRGSGARPRAATASRPGRPPARHSGSARPIIQVEGPRAPPGALGDRPPSTASRSFASAASDAVGLEDPRACLRGLGKRPVRDAFAVRKAAPAEDARVREPLDELARPAATCRPPLRRRWSPSAGASAPGTLRQGVRGAWRAPRRARSGRRAEPLDAAHLVGVWGRPPPPTQVRLPGPAPGSPWPRPRPLARRRGARRASPRGGSAAPTRILPFPARPAFCAQPRPPARSPLPISTSSRGGRRGPRRPRRC